MGGHKYRLNVIGAFDQDFCKATETSNVFVPHEQSYTG